MGLNNSKIQGLVVFILGSLCLGLSTIQTASGYEKAAGGVGKAIVVSIIITLVLVLINFRIWNSYQSGIKDSIFLPLTVYTIVAAFSFAANFNSFFSQDMGEKLLVNTIDEMRKDLDAINYKGIKIIENTIEQSRKLVKEIELEKITLLSQIRDQGNPGIGRKAKQKIEKINTLLGIELSLPNGAPESQAKELEKQIDQLIKQKNRNSHGTLSKQKEGVKEKIKLLEEKINSVKETGCSNTSVCISELESITFQYNDIIEQLSHLVGDSDNFPVQKKTNDIRNLGKISHSIKTSLSMDNKLEIATPLLLSFLIDLIVPLVIVVLKSGRKITATGPVVNGFPKLTRKEFGSEDVLDDIVRQRKAPPAMNANQA